MVPLRHASAGAPGRQPNDMIAMDQYHQGPGYHQQRAYRRLIEFAAGSVVALALVVAVVAGVVVHARAGIDCVGRSLASATHACADGEGRTSTPSSFSIARA